MIKPDESIEFLDNAEKQLLRETEEKVDAALKKSRGHVRVAFAPWDSHQRICAELMRRYRAAGWNVEIDTVERARKTPPQIEEVALERASNEGAALTIRHPLFEVSPGTKAPG